MSVERIRLGGNILFYTIDADAGELQEKGAQRPSMIWAGV